MRVAVVGAGIGGLTVATALAAEGHTVVVVERSAGFDADGAGLVLAPNAIHVLAALGIDLAGTGWLITRSELVGADGRVLTGIDLGRRSDAAGPTYAIGRPHLHTALSRALPRTVEVVLGHSVRAVQEGPRDVALDWGAGERRFDVVVAADGLHSTVRTAAVGPVRLRYSGTTCWRGIIDFAAGHTATEAWGPGARVGVVPVAPCRTYYYLLLSAPPRAPDLSWPDGFDACFGHFRGVPGDLVRALPGAPALHHDLVELDHPTWGCPRILLLGDAAHAMTPNQGQGAAMAIEDALAVAAALRPGVTGALDRYRSARHGRVRRVQMTSRRIGAVAHWGHPAVRALRDEVMAVVPGWAGRAGMRSLVQPGIDLASSWSRP